MAEPQNIETLPSNAKQTRWWLVAILAFVIPSGFGILIGFNMTPAQDDWLGMRCFIPILSGLLIGAILEPIFAFLSIKQGERLSGLAILLAIPCIAFLAYTVIVVLKTVTK